MNDTGSWNFFEPHRASERRPATALTVRGQWGVLQIAAGCAAYDAGELRLSGDARSRDARREYWGITACVSMATAGFANPEA
jgi:hypothetical protein